MAHYFSDALGAKAFKSITTLCTQQTGRTIKNSPIQHEAFKDSILVQLAGGNPPDVYSYWAGAKTQYLVDQKRMAPLDDFWAKNDLDKSIPQSLSKASAEYNGQKYLLPFDYHYVGVFYNPKVMAKAGVTTMPKTWDELMAAAAKLKAAGITPFALGSKNQWPAQFWFDYLLLRTAGPDYRQKLMAGQAKYTDPQVKTAFSMWKELFDKGYFNKSPNGIDWPDAADMVSKGQAAMTLNGTWVTGYWDDNKVPAVQGYDMFPFPEVTPGVPQAALGPVDGWALSTAAPNKAAADDLLKCLSGPEAQRDMALAQGALAPNKNADLTSQNEVMHKAAKEVQTASTFVFNYDLATPPEMSEPGLNMIQKFVDDPSKLDGDLQEAQSAADGAFKKN
ncbi:extracellular solute-binding protein [Actinomadura harenae]|uniref:Extracellular solute-binding protein n=2 Tax=Actinomadura harenae TaxID=2483351 RepID=A0A3M2M647_9ACTN|nr:extracellular solute-binding protein [Actinomadura harenae]